MKDISLYELSNALDKIEEMSDDDKSLLEYLDSVQMQINEKIDNIVRFRRTTELTVAAIDSEIERLIALKGTYGRRNENLKKYLAYCLKKMGKDKFESAVAKMGFRTSQAVVIDDPTKLPKEFIKEKVSVAPDKIAIKEALKSGKGVEGAHIEEHENLIIK